LISICIVSNQTWPEQIHSMLYITSITYLPALQFDTTGSHSHPDRLLIRKGRECKALGTASLAVKHDSGIHDLPKLSQKVLERFRRDTGSETAHKDLGSALVLGTGNGPFGVNLHG
jgi:hypothetical protein